MSLFLISHQLNFFHNTYSILKTNYNIRLINFYGDCGKISYGFVKNIYDDLNLRKKLNIHSKNIKILNFGDYPSVYSYFYNPKFDESVKYVIVLNINEIDLKKQIQKFRNYIKK